jgi:transcriptional regulator with XRE-family HTH domain
MFDFKIFREKNDFTQKEIADYFGVSQAFISQIEKKIRPVPDHFISKIKADNMLISEPMDLGENIDYREKYYAVLEENRVLNQKHTRALEKVIGLHEKIGSLSDELAEVKKELVEGVLGVRDVLMRSAS